MFSACVRDYVKCVCVCAGCDLCCGVLCPSIEYVCFVVVYCSCMYVFVSVWFARHNEATHAWCVVVAIVCFMYVCKRPLACGMP